MIIFRPHISFYTLDEVMSLTREFENIDEMKQYIYEQWNKTCEYFSINDIVINDCGYDDYRVGWEGVHSVCIKKFGTENYMEKYGCLQHIGEFAIKYNQTIQYKQDKIKRKTKLGGI